MVRILVLDNYDSFTYNLVQYLQQENAEVIVQYNDVLRLEDIRDLNLDGIVISPGPGTPTNPADIGICREVIEQLSFEIPILGVCLGHQLIGDVYGGMIVQTAPKHGSISPVRRVGNSRLLPDLPEYFDVMRYHSLIIDRGTFPKELLITAETEDGIVMALEHPDTPLFGVQFHPESVGTPIGYQIIAAFVRLCRR